MIEILEIVLKPYHLIPQAVILASLMGLVLLSNRRLAESCFTWPADIIWWRLWLKRYFTTCKIPSTGPDILLFKRFKDHWQFIIKDQFEVKDHNIQNPEDIISFCLMHLAVKQSRDDYRELLEISIIFLGGTPPRGIKFMKPGALHRARWMARFTYAIKICLFQS